MPPITPMVRNLLILNVLMFILTDRLFPQELFALHDIRSDLFRPHQFITHMFMHGNLMHLFGNMFSLFMFGPLLERHWGEGRFLTFYMITGLGASLLYSGVRYYEISQVMDGVTAFMQNPDPIDFKNLLETAGVNLRGMESFLVEFNRNPSDPQFITQAKAFSARLSDVMVNSPMLGASGAVFGILMAFGMLFPNTELMLLFFPIPIKAKYFVLMYGAFEMYAGLNRTPGDNVAHFAHLGGMLFAYILLKLWERKRNNFY
ncbi:rhomboid family intramembrane serine protease [Rufibacter glacialis]|uniref:Rhomboid family intramembrane serine protease n=1 Tax=Rufibacter glacialis TaxID=1259555 RepID=A0A5M8QNI4_9BACT|nr:rhomboid family intramembrane serine protease [Rufibacter glacialis]KAA6435752.1 rhomboid family intramembrane serine protease [Rufibacter glacialis]GGK66194.1 rhomboid family intramembrane serine protease [Rufibacter glacialis]